MSAPAHTPHIDAEAIASQCAEAVRPEKFEPFIRKMADELYGQMLEAAQDYMKDNAHWNIRAHIDVVQGENTSLRQTVAELVQALQNAIAEIEDGRIYELMCCDGQMCGCQGSPNSEYLVHCLREVLAKAGAA